VLPIIRPFVRSLEIRIKQNKRTHAEKSTPFNIQYVSANIPNWGRFPLSLAKLSSLPSRCPFNKKTPNSPTSTYHTSKTR
jgi:hypothetical protein